MLLVTESRTLKLQLKLVRASTRIASNPFSVFNSPSSSFAGEPEEGKEKKEEQTMAFNPEDFKIIKEGEAEMLMHKKNTVFFNKAQVTKKFAFLITVYDVLL